MKKITITLIYIVFGGVVFAQRNTDTIPERPINGISLSLLGDASIISFHYERLFLIRNNFFITGKLGLGYIEEFQLCLFGSCSTPEKYLTIPHHITGNIGRGKNFFEFGLGGTIINGNTSQHYLLYPIVGYRLQPKRSNKFNLRIFAEFPVSRVEDILFVPFGLSMGIYF